MLYPRHPAQLSSLLLRGWLWDPPRDSQGLGAILKGPGGEAWGQYHAPHPVVLDGAVIPSAQLC